MDGENNGKPYPKWMIWGEPPLFSETSTSWAYFCHFCPILWIPPFCWGIQRHTTPVPTSTRWRFEIWVVPLNTASDPREAAGWGGWWCEVVGQNRHFDDFANVFFVGRWRRSAGRMDKVAFIHWFIHAFIRSFVRSFFLRGVKHGLKAHQGETLICLTKYPLAPKTALYIRKNYTTNLSPEESSFLFLDSHGMVRSFSFKTPPEAGAARAPLRVGVWVPLNAKDRTRGWWWWWWSYY